MELLAGPNGMKCAFVFFVADGKHTARKERKTMLILLVVLVVLLLATAPTWPYSRGWGYYPSGGLGAILLIVLLMMALGFVHI